jgi:membrane-associated phospholipid phosphatase
VGTLEQPVSIEAATPTSAASIQPPASVPATAAVSTRGEGRTRRWARAAGWWLVAFVVACGWDRAVWLMVTKSGVPVLLWLKKLEDLRTYGETLRGAMRLEAHAVWEAIAGAAYLGVYGFGRLYLWAALALFFIFRHWGGTDAAKVREGLRRGVFVFLVPVAAGGAAEALKLLTRRLRPEENQGLYAFKPVTTLNPLSTNFWDNSSLGLASSHAAVAFGAALAAGILLPRLRWPLLALAFLCTLSRVAVGAHFLSDAIAGTALAFVAFHGIYAWDARNNKGIPIAA